MLLWNAIREVVVALSECVMKNQLKRLYLGNHAVDHYHEVLVAYYVL